VKSRVPFAIIALAALFGLASPLRAAELIGVDFFGMLYDMTETGVASNPRATGVGTLSGIAFSNGVLYGLDAGTDYLWRINPANGASTQIGFLGLDVTEGDLGFDPISGQLYGVQSFGDDRLYTINTATGVATTIGTIAADADISAIAFDSTGALFALDTYNDVIYRVDPSDASILQTIPLMVGQTPIDLGPAAGMVYNPDSGVFYFADGGPFGTDQFYLYSPALQIVFPFGQMTLNGAPLSEGLSGLAYIPEPATLCLLLTGVFALRRRR